MEGTTEAMLVKQSKTWILAKNDRGDEIETKENDPKPREDPKKEDEDDNVTLVYCSKKKNKGGRKPCKTEASLLSIATSLNNNCCLCFGAFARYIRAVFGCVSCLALCHMPEMQFECLFCELIEAIGDACYDLVCFLWKFLHLCVGAEKC